MQIETIAAVVLSLIYKLVRDTEDRANVVVSPTTDADGVFCVHVRFPTSFGEVNDTLYVVVWEETYIREALLGMIIDRAETRMVCDE